MENYEVQIKQKSLDLGLKDKMLPAVAVPFPLSLREFPTQKEADKAEMSVKKCCHFWELF